ncbi:MAG: hypothetical protein SO011_05510 [Prevotella sp.]|nr:hypothetical protein [Prevotella sp.]
MAGARGADTDRTPTAVRPYRNCRTPVFHLPYERIAVGVWSVSAITGRPKGYSKVQR